jgi:hypothetical protein
MILDVRLYLQAAAGVGRPSEQRLVQNNAHGPDVHLTIHEINFLLTFVRSKVHCFEFKKMTDEFFFTMTDLCQYTVESWAKSTIFSND